MTIKRLLACLMAICLLVSVVYAQGGTETANTNESEYTPVVLKVGTSSAESTLQAKAFRYWNDKLEAATEGKVKLEIYYSSVLGNNSERAQGCQLGTIDITIHQPSGCADMGAKKMNLLTLPYMFESYEHYIKTISGEVGQELLDDVSVNVPGIIGFGYVPDGGRCFFTKGKPLTKLSDGKGLKMRVQPYEMDTAYASALGFQPTPIAFSELYSAMQSGVVDGAENPVSGIDGNKLYEVADYLIMDNHTYNILVLMFSEKTWDKLNEKTRDILTSTWKETIEECFNPQLRSTEEELLAKFEASGVTVTRELSDYDEWVKAVEPVWSKYGAGLEDLISKVQSLR